MNTYERIGRYQIIRELGRGGMAVVYEALDASLNRRVALKVLAKHLAHETAFVARFRTEAQAAAALSHRNIVTIYEVGEDGGKHYIAMEYLEGDLETRIEHQGALSIEETVGIASGVAAGLEAAHGKGIVHRDIKPSNIMFDALGQPKIADFGIVRMLEGTRLTSMGMSVGTPKYMSPEQATGGAVDHRTDIYSLGIVMYEMLTGQAPFTASTPLAVAYMHRNEALPPLRAVRPDVPDWLDSAITVCTAKDAEKRWQSAADLAAALETRQVSVPTHGEPVHGAGSSAAPTWQPTDPLVRPRRDDRSAGTAGRIALAFLAVAAVVSLYALGGWALQRGASRPQVQGTDTGVGRESKTTSRGANGSGLGEDEDRLALEKAGRAWLDATYGSFDRREVNGVQVWGDWGNVSAWNGMSNAYSVFFRREPDGTWMLWDVTNFMRLEKDHARKFFDALVAAGVPWQVVPVLDWDTCCEQYTLGDLPGAPPGVHPVVYVTTFEGDALLLGGTADGRWMDADAMRSRLDGTGKYSLFFLGEAVGETPGSAVTGQSKVGLHVRLQQARDRARALGCAGARWTICPRLATDVDTSSAPARQLTRGATRELKTDAWTPSAVMLEQAVLVDLDGDGARELLAAGRGTPQGGQVTRHRCFTAIAAEDGSRARLLDCDWSLTDTDPPSVDMRIAGTADLNGDGTLEIVTARKRGEGYTVMVYTITKYGLMRVLEAPQPF